MEPRNELIKQILDENKRSWDTNSDSGGDGDIFYTQVVRPLRELRDEGFFERLHEHAANEHGRQVIDRVDIGGSINLEFQASVE
jgi:hypothetical protein